MFYMYRLTSEILRFHPISPFIFPLQFLYPIPPFLFPLQSLYPSQVSSYIPFHFSFTVPLSYTPFHFSFTVPLSYTPFHFSFTVPLSYTPFHFTFTVPLKILVWPAFYSDNYPWTWEDVRVELFGLCLRYLNIIHKGTVRVIRVPFITRSVHNSQQYPVETFVLIKVDGDTIFII